MSYKLAGVLWNDDGTMSVVENRQNTFTDTGIQYKSPLQLLREILAGDERCLDLLDQVEAQLLEVTNQLIAANRVSSDNKRAHLLCESIDEIIHRVDKLELGTLFDRTITLTCHNIHDYDLLKRILLHGKQIFYVD